MTSRIVRTGRFRFTSLLGAALVALGQFSSSGHAHDVIWLGDDEHGVTSTPGPQSLVPDSVAMNPAVRAAIDAAWLTVEERADLRVFHGVWEDGDLNSAARRARAALTDWRLGDPSLDDPETPIELRAEAQLRRGRLASAVAMLEHEHSIVAARIRAEALEGLGQDELANAAVDAPVKALLDAPSESAAWITDVVRAMRVRARVEGQPSRDFRNMMSMLGTAHQDLDRLYWPARLVEAELLVEKFNAEQAVQALLEVLALNPRCSEAWFGLGMIGLRGFNFDAAEFAAYKLRELNEGHPLAAILLARVRLYQDDPGTATALLESLTAEWPGMRQAHALLAASAAITYDETEMQRALDAYDVLSPGSAEAYFEAGKQMSMNRQYEEAALLLEEAIRRKPNWPTPRIELGLMELQSGRDMRARAALREAAAMDPFNKRAANSLFLIEDIVENYETVETEHFIVRYAPGIDQVLIDMMPHYLDEIHRIVSSRFQFAPSRKTVLEVLPNHQRFAVRITGMPGLFTIAACTGPVIAMEVPREGPQGKHLGLFDWPRVIQHEYTHTVTLAQTKNRIPHWLTEACAVEMELAPRDYGRSVMLADAWRNGTLFTLDEIKWGFVRPRRPGDRSKAYAQSRWMLEFMNERFGRSAVVRVMEQYAAGLREGEAIRVALGVSRDQFYQDFLVWAGNEVESWGLGTSPTVEDLKDEVRQADAQLREQMRASRRSRLEVLVNELTDQIGRPSSGDGSNGKLTASQWPPLIKPEVEITEIRLMNWMKRFPNHPDLWEIKVRSAIHHGSASDDDLVEWLNRYAELRPVDSFPHRRLAQVYLDRDDPEKAIASLEYLDVREESTPVFAMELARLYRATGDVDRAIEKAMRAVQINPYNAPNREFAAALAIEGGNLALARDHIRALTLLEPDRPLHQQRLERIESMLGG